MSIENHPNIHASGMTVDIIHSIINRVRGAAGEVPVGQILTLLDEDIQNFVVQVSIKLDETFSAQNV
jgi:hypothetical protein